MTRVTQCALAYAFPTTQRDFNWSVQQGHSEYTKRFAGGWVQYDRVCTSLNDGINRYRRLGLTQIKERVTVEDLGKLYERCTVVLLFAHRIVDANGLEYVELWDSILDPTSFAQLAPVEYEGVIDLSVCGSGAFVDAVKRRATECTVSYSPENVSPMIWSQIYGDVFEVLSRYPHLAYQNVLTDIILEHRRQAKNGIAELCRKIFRRAGGG